MGGPRKRFMANIPGAFSWRLPSADPTEMIIEKRANSYVIGWNPINLWHDKELQIYTIRDIAKKIILDYCSLNFPCEGYNYMVFFVQFKPTLIVRFDTYSKVGDGIDQALFLDELTKELESLKKLIPFS